MLQSRPLLFALEDLNHQRVKLHLRNVVYGHNFSPENRSTSVPKEKLISDSLRHDKDVLIHKQVLLEIALYVSFQFGVVDRQRSAGDSPSDEHALTLPHFR